MTDEITQIQQDITVRKYRDFLMRAPVVYCHKEPTERLTHSITDTWKLGTPKIVYGLYIRKFSGAELRSLRNSPSSKRGEPWYPMLQGDITAIERGLKFMGYGPDTPFVVDVRDLIPCRMPRSIWNLNVKQPESDTDLRVQFWLRPLLACEHDWTPSDGYSWPMDTWKALRFPDNHEGWLQD